MQKIAVGWLCAERHVACGHEGDKAGIFGLAARGGTVRILEEGASRKAKRPLWQLVQVVHDRKAPAAQQQQRGQD
jgi:hypothetical protein